jgi:PAS domain S-box-containing protein
MELDSSKLRRSMLAARGMAIVILIIASIVLLGWTLRIELLKSVTVHGVSMKSNTAAALMLTGIALLLLLPPAASQRRQLAGKLLACVVLAIGVLTFIQHPTGWNLGIDQLLFKEPPGEIYTASPNRMGPPASLSFALAGAALLMINWRTRTGHAPMQWCAMTVIVIAILPLLGYLTNAPQLFGIARLTGIAPHTACTLLLLGVALLAARPDARPVRLLILSNAGGEMARRLLPAALLVPIILGTLRAVGARRVWFDDRFSQAILILAIMAIFTAMVWHTAHRLAHLANLRDQAVETSQAIQAKALRLATEHSETAGLLDSLLANAPIGFAFFDEQHRYVRINDFQARVNGLPAEEHIGQHISAVVPVNAAVVEPVLDRIFTTGESVGGFEVSGETPAQPGVRRHWITGFYPVRDANDRVRIVGAVVLEITERKKLEEQRAALLDSERAARADAERAGRLKDEFLATVSHELRTPLNAILGWATILRTGSFDANDVEQALATIERNARAQAQLIEDLLDVSRIISGKLRLDVQAVDLPAVIDTALSAVRPAADAREIRLHHVVDPQAGPVSGDPARLQQIVWNLLSNAVKFTPKGGRVELIVQRVESQVQISVSDSGMGIPAEFLPHVFERFRQADASTTRKHGGLGLGLSIVKQLTEMHGGSVRALSPGQHQGSTFIVTLPVTALHDATQATSLASPSAADQRRPPDMTRLDGLRVLVVDDEADARELIRRVLADRDANVNCAASTDDALLALEEFDPDVIVSDIGMPEKDGYALIREIRQRIGAKNVPAIALTAFARPEDRRRSLLAGYQVHIAKPVDPHELTAAVASLAGRTGQQ